MIQQLIRKKYKSYIMLSILSCECFLMHFTYLLTPYQPLL